MTMVELLVSSAILVVVLGIVYTVLFTALGASVKQTDRSLTNDQARQAVEQIDREIRSGNVFFDPANEATDAAHQIAPTMSLRVYTQADYPTFASNRCYQWRVTTDGLLQSRSWQSDADGTPRSATVTNFHTVADHIVNRVNSPNVPAFVMTLPNRTVTITMVVNQRSRSGSDERIESAVTGRNTEYNQPSTVSRECTTIPSY